MNAILATLTYTGDLNFNGNDTLTIMTSDGSLTDTDTVAITVGAVNDAPVAGDDVAPAPVIESKSLIVDAANGVLANDTDVDGDTLSVTSITGTATETPVSGVITVAGSHGTLVLDASTGAYSYTSTTGFGTDTFTYTVSDGNGGTDTATLTIEVTEQGFRALDAASVDGSGNIFVGTGNTGTSYNVSENHAAGLELGLKIHYRTGDDIAPVSQDADGTAHYIVPVGTQVVDLAHDVLSSERKPCGVELRLLGRHRHDGQQRQDAGELQLHDHDLGRRGPHARSTTWCTGPADTPWQLRGGPASGFSDDDGTGHPTLSQNSVNIGFDFLQAAFGDNLAGKHFDIELTATDAVTGVVMASTHDQIVVDTPPVATPNVASVTEESVLLATGNVITDAPADSDLNGDAITVSAVNGIAGNVGNDVVGVYGTLHLNADGSYTYTLANGQANVQALGAGESATDTFTYTVTDGITPNAVSTATLTVTVNGTNDAVASPATVTVDVTEDFDTVANGNVLDDVTDVDVNDVHTVTAVNGSGANVGNAVAGPTAR